MLTPSGPFNQNDEEEKRALEEEEKRQLAEIPLSILLMEAEASFNDFRFDPLEFEVKAREVLESLYAPGAYYDLREGKRLKNPHGPFHSIAHFLFLRRYTSSAIDILTGRWEELAALQSPVHQIYRASISNQLGEYYLLLNDQGAALRWFLLTYADDLLGGFDGGNGKQKLKATLGMSPEQLNRLSEQADKNKSEVQKRNDWSIAEGYAEDVIVHFMLDNPEFINLFAKASSVESFPLSKTYFSKLLQLAKDRSADSDTRGRRLENLVAYLLWLVPAWIPLRNVQDSRQISEHDFVVRNLNRGVTVPSLLGDYFLVECKNKHSTPKATGKMSSSEVGYFLYRMHCNDCKFGMIFSWEGLSGTSKEAKAERRNAVGLTEKGFHRDGITCIVLDKNHYEALADGRKTFLGLLVELIEEFRFGKSKKRN